MAIHALLAQVQKHALCEEKIFLPLSAKITNRQEVQVRVDALRKEHESLCELISIMLKKEEEGITATGEQEAFHVLLVNHIRNEEEVLGILDESLSESEKQAAISR